MLYFVVFCGLMLSFPDKITAQHKSELRHQRDGLFGMHFILATHPCSNPNTSQNACKICAPVVFSQQLRSSGPDTVLDPLRRAQVARSDLIFCLFSMAV